MRYKTVLVAGATGFLGTHLCIALRERGYTVFGIGRLDRMHMFIDDVDAAIHLAAQTEVGKAHDNPVETLEANVAGTWRFLEACRKAKVKRILVASSDKVYGSSGREPYREDWSLAPKGVYAYSKACADMLCAMYAAEYSMSIAVTRCTNLYGPGHMNMTALIPDTIQRLLRGQQPVLRSDGTMKRDWLYVADAVDGYLGLLESDEVGAFNFGTGQATSVLDTVKLLCRLMGSDLKPEIQATAMHEIDEQRADCTKARTKLGWRSQTELKEGLAKTIEWHRELNL